MRYLLARDYDMRGRAGDEEEPDERNPAFERFENLAKKLLRVPKDEADEKRRKHERERERRAG
jgi:hypothetical protein